MGVGAAKARGRAVDGGEVVATIAGLYGLIIGSFLNVVIHRVPRGASVVRPPSACPRCDHEIAWYDNLPVLSWVLLRRRCRSCSAPIAWRYPLVEATTAGVFVAVSLSVGLKWVLGAYLFFAAVLVALSGIDIDTRKIPNAVLYPSWAVSVVLLSGGAVLDGDPGRLVWAAAGAGIGFAVLFVIWFVAPGGMGYGDVRLAGYIGLHLGYLSIGRLAVGLFLGFLAGALGGAAVLLVTGRGRGTKIPFGPFLALGALAAVVAGQPIVDAYLSL